MNTTILPTTGLLRQLSQHPVLPLLVTSSGCPFRPPAGVGDRMGEPKRLSGYLIFFMIDGQTTHSVDLRTMTLGSGHVLFIQPNQIHRNLSGWPEARQWYKMAFDEQSLKKLPRHLDFLDDPLGLPAFPVSPRLANGFEMLIQVLGHRPAPVDLIVAYLHVLLTEMNEAYFRQAGAKAPISGNLDIYLRFKRLVEEVHAEQPPVHRLASSLLVSENRLYTVVRQFAGVSPKAFILRRTILEAQRLFYYDRPPVKEVAYTLGFNDPDHFSRVFKRVTGETVKTFLAGIQDSSSK